MGRKCTENNKQGEPCGAYAWHDNTEFCYFHDPEAYEQSRADQVAGGKQSGVSKRIEKLRGEVIKAGQLADPTVRPDVAEIQTLDDLRKWVLSLISDITERSTWGNRPSYQEMGLLLRYGELLLKILMVGGAGFEGQLQIMRELLEDEQRNRLTERASTGGNKE